MISKVGFMRWRADISASILSRNKPACYARGEGRFGRVVRCKSGLPNARRGLDRNVQKQQDDQPIWWHTLANLRCVCRILHRRSIMVRSMSLRVINFDQLTVYEAGAL